MHVNFDRSLITNPWSAREKSLLDCEYNFILLCVCIPQLPLDHATYTLNLTLANQQDATPYFELAYSAKEAYSLPGLSPQDWASLGWSMATDNQLFEEYIRCVSDWWPILFEAVGCRSLQCCSDVKRRIVRHEGSILSTLLISSRYSGSVHPVRWWISYMRIDDRLTKPNGCVDCLWPRPWIAACE